MKYSIIDIGGGRKIRRPDPEGRELWELNGKWETKPGRKPSREGPLKHTGMLLRPEIITWLKAQPGGMALTIERLVEAEIQNRQKP